MHLDAAFVIGDGHTVCQDYASAFTVEDRAYIMVSDGCSSSPHTDIGARILTHQVMACLAAGMRVQQALFNEVLKRARAVVQHLQLPRSALDCTLLIAEHDQERVRIIAIGDGVIAYTNREGDLAGFELTTPSQSPGYLNYWGDEERIHHYRQQDQGLVYRALGSDHTQHHPSGLHAFSMTLPSAQLTSLALYSDGVSSFPQVSVEEVLTHLGNFPTNQGAFAQRRLRKFTRKTCKKRGWTHQDDLALAVMAFA